MQYMLLQEVPLDDMIYVTSALIIDEISIVAFYLFIYLCGIHQQSLLISIGPLLVYKPSWLKSHLWEPRLQKNVIFKGGVDDQKTRT